jgi:NAD-dependent dihydropyrimidine dehydrogenase PreA subunit
MAKRKIIKIDEKKCNGCGECVPNCAEGALRIIDGKARLVSDVFCDGLGACLGHCPQGAITIEERDAEAFGRTELRQWPVQIMLVPPIAPYFNNADLLIAADCVPFAYPDFHRELLKGKILLVGCPKLDDLSLYKDKISQILKANNIKSVTYAHMEVPCCFGLIGVVEDAITASGKNIPFNNVTVSIGGELIR